MKNIRVDNPCPMLLMRMEKAGESFTCKSCNKEVVDYRKIKDKELKKIVKPETCGIFYTSQLQGQKKVSRPRKLLFYTLTLLSFLGFKVSPLSAQEGIATDTVNYKPQDSTNYVIGKQRIIPTNKKDNPIEGEEKDKNKKATNRKKKYHTIGTPAF